MTYVHVHLKPIPNKLTLSATLKVIKEQTMWQHINMIKHNHHAAVVRFYHMTHKHGGLMHNPATFDARP